MTTDKAMSFDIGAARKADLGAPLCRKCEDMDVYDRSPESCGACAEIRVKAVIASLNIEAAIQKAVETEREEIAQALEGKSYWKSAAPMVRARSTQPSTTTITSTEDIPNEGVFCMGCQSHTCEHAEEVNQLTEDTCQ